MTDAPERIWTNGRPGGHWSEGIPGAGDCPVFYLRADAVEARLAAAEAMALTIRDVLNTCTISAPAQSGLRAALTAWEAAKGEK